jgi:NAD(P)-dependent dehydrogenase (short-subunit alcohol dehydrogenase family)
MCATKAKLPNLTGKVSVITGATSGIGRMAARALAATNADLILVGRNQRAGGNILRRLRANAPGARVEFIQADLSSQRDVRMLANRIGQNRQRVDVLINNAGARFDTYQVSVDGIELTFATNHLGHFLLTRLLFEPLRRAPAARVITVSSSAHASGGADGVLVLGRANYNRRLAYAKSKLANVMFAYHLSERLHDTRVTSNVVDPGFVLTNCARNNGVVSWLKHIVAHAVRLELVLPRKGAESLIYLAAAEDVQGVTGKYFRRGREVASSPAAYDRTAVQHLWDLSERLTGTPCH